MPARSIGACLNQIATRLGPKNEARAASVTLAVFGLGTILLPSLATADLVYFQFNGVGAADVVTLNFNDGQGYALSGQFYAGQYSATLSPNADLWNGETFNTFCVDMYHEVQNGQEYPVNVISTSLLPANGAAVAYLYNTYGVSTISDPDYAAGLQLAIWDELYNNGQGQSGTSPLQYSIPDQAVADNLAFFLAQAQENAANGQWAQSVDNPIGYVQGQGFLVPPMAGIPEPSTFVLSGLACISLIGMARGRRRLHAYRQRRISIHGSTERPRVPPSRH